MDLGHTRGSLGEWGGAMSDGLGGCCCCYCIRQTEIGIIEQFGQFKDLKPAAPPKRRGRAAGPSASATV